MVEIVTAETLASLMFDMPRDQHMSSEERAHHEVQKALANRLIEQVAKGEITPEYADEFALRSNLGRLSNPPEPSNFDIKKIGFWNLEMVVAWIIWRDDEVVLRHLPEFYSNHRVWLRSDKPKGRAFPPIRMAFPPNPPQFTLAQLAPHKSHQSVPDCEWSYRTVWSPQMGAC